MIRSKSFRPSGSAALATLLFLVSTTVLLCGLSAQSATPVAAASAEQAALAPFLVAPSIALADNPTSVATADLNHDGKLDLITANYASGRVTVFLGLGNGRFAPGVHYSAGTHPSALAVADLDGSGRLDVIVASESEATVSVFPGSGDGRLQPRHSFAVGFNPTLLATGDFKGRGKIDLAVASANHLAVLLNDGNGGLLKPLTLSLHTAPAAIAVGHFTHDDRADIALANADGTVSILLGKGDGAFRQVPDVRVSSGPLSSIAAADLKRDGKTDLVVTQAASKLASVLSGNGEGGFTPTAHYPVGSNPVASVVADFDGDGVVDLIIVNHGSNTFSVLGGKGDGSFKASVDFVVGKGPLAAVDGDFDGDGRIDLAVINHLARTISIPRGNGDGTFTAARSYVSELGPRTIATGDLNGDGRPDLVVTNTCGTDASCKKAGSLSIFLAEEAGGYRLATTYPLGIGPHAVSLVDVDGDKTLDIAVLNRADKTVTILRGIGEGSFQQSLSFAVPDAPVALAVGDFTSHGKSDLAIIGDCGAEKCSQPGSLTIMRGIGDGSFRLDRSYPVGYSPVSIAAGHLVSDKSFSLVVANRCGNDASCKSSGTASIFLGTPKGDFTPAKDVNIGLAPSSIALGNTSGHGSADLVVARAGDNSVAILHGKGDGSFSAPTAYPVGNQPRSIALADFDGDGLADVAVSNFQDDTVSVLFSRGDGTLRPAIALPVGSGPESLAVLSSGTHASLVTANGNSGTATPGSEITVLASIRPEVLLTSTTTLTSSAATSAVDSSITLTAIVAGAGSVPSGSVTFNSTPDATIDCNAGGIDHVTLDGNGKAICVTRSLQAPSQSVTAAYGGDVSFKSSSSAPALVQTVTPLAASLALAQSAATTTVNQSVTFTATVSASAVSPLAPAGSVTFKFNGNSIADCLASPVDATGKATCTTSSLAANSYTVSAAYAGDNNFTVAAPTTATHVVSMQTTTVTVAALPTPSNLNQPVTFTAAVAATRVTPIAIGGTVAFSFNGNPIAGCPSAAVNASGKATCTVSSLPANTYSVKATYNGDTNYSTSTSTAISQVVKPLAATLALAAAPNPSNVDDGVTFTATLTAAAVTPVPPAGTISFLINGAPSTDCPAVAVNASNQASCKTQFLLAQSNVVSATYSGDGNFVAATPASVTQKVNKGIPINSITATPPSPSVNQTTTFTANILPPALPAGSGKTPISPTGTVTFREVASGGVTTVLCTSVALAANVNAASTATCNHAFNAAIPAPGSSITATYTGDTNFTPGSVASVNLLVGATGTTVSLTSSPSASTLNQSVAFTAVISSASGGATKPKGTVVFADALTGTNVCPSVTVKADGTVPVCNSAVLAVGTHPITARYTSADANFQSANSAVLNQVVSATATATTVAATPTPSEVNQPVVLSATVTAAVPGAAIPQGTVTYTDGLTGTNLCTKTLLAAGTVPNCTVTFAAAGSHTITATYTNTDGNFLGSTSTPYNQLVNSNATTVTLASALPTSSVNQPVKFTATIKPSTPLGAGATNPSGNVTFSYLAGGSKILLCPSASPVSTTAAITTASCTAALPATGTYAINAVYSGDGNFTTGTSAAITQTVNPTTTNTSTPTGAPAPSVVNQTVTFSTSVAPQFTLPTVPTGTVVYRDTFTNTVLCTVTLNSDGTTPNCPAALLVIGAHTVTAAYSGDTNFTASTSSAYTQNVAKSTTTLTVVSSSGPVSPASVATQPVTFTATLTTPFPPGTAPTGAVTFSLNGDALDSCTPAPGPLPLTGPFAVTCTITFSPSIGGPVVVTASYAGDGSFLASSGSVTQTVQNFSLALSTAGPIYVTQNFTNVTDPFSAQTVTVKSVPVPNSGAAQFNDLLDLTCVVTDSTGAQVGDPTCVVTNTLAGNGSATPAVTIAATSTAAIGNYTVTLTGVDHTTKTLVHQKTVIVSVVGLNASLALGPGATGIENVGINTASAIGPPVVTTTLDAFACTAITVGGKPASGITCVLPTSPVSITTGLTTIPVTIQTLAPTTTVAEVKQHGGGSIAMAALLGGVPFLALFGWMGRRRAAGISLTRFLGVMLLLVGLSIGIGCGGSFTPPPAPTGGTAIGAYFIQISAWNTAAPSVKYFAVVPLAVN